MANSFKPRVYISSHLQEQLCRTTEKVIAEVRARREAELELERVQDRRREVKQLIWLFLAIVVLAWLAAMLWRHIFNQIGDDLRHEVDVAAAQWLDTSDARQCFDYRGLKDGRMVMGCKDGRSYEVLPDVVERAQKMREDGRQ